MAVEFFLISFLSRAHLLTFMTFFVKKRCKFEMRVQDCLYLVCANDVYWFRLKWHKRHFCKLPVLLSSFGKQKLTKIMYICMYFSSLSFFLISLLMRKDCKSSQMIVVYCHWAIGSQACPTLCNTWRLCSGHLRGPWYSHLLQSVWQWNCHYSVKRLRSVAIRIQTHNHLHARR